MSYTKSHVKSVPPSSTLGKLKDPSMNVSQSTAEMLKIKIKRNHVEYTLANLDTLCKISKPLPLKKCSVKIPSFGKNENPTGSTNIRQLNMEQTQNANCILLFFHKTQNANCILLFFLKYKNTTLPSFQNTSFFTSIFTSFFTSFFTSIVTSVFTSNVTSVFT